MPKDKATINMSYKQKCEYLGYDPNNIISGIIKYDAHTTTHQAKRIRGFQTVIRGTKHSAANK